MHGSRWRVADLSARGPDSNFLIRPDLLAVANYVYAASPEEAADDGRALLGTGRW